MDDLVVIILTLLIVGAGAIGQLKKKKQVPEGTEEQKNKGGIWDLFKEGVFAQEPESQTPTPSTEQEEYEPYENEQGYEIEAKNKGGKLTDDNVKPEPATINKDEKIKEGFSLRKAVIYNEILNRKYN